MDQSQNTCKNCGAALTPGQKFCPQCGYTDKMVSTGSSSTKTILIVVVSVLAALCLCGAIAAVAFTFLMPANGMNLPWAATPTATVTQTQTRTPTIVPPTSTPAPTNTTAPTITIAPSQTSRPTAGTLPIIITPTRVPTAGPSSVFTVTPNAYAACSGSRESHLYVGNQAVVTPGLSNRVRAKADTKSAILGEITAGTVVTIIGGPVCAEGWVWWKIRAPNGLEGYTAEGDNKDYWLAPVTK